jgi:glycosyltransferase involved in cell wall biosynthesis
LRRYKTIKEKKRVRPNNQDRTTTSPIRLAMIGPFPHAWGGKPQAGGVATHVWGLISALPEHNVRVRVLADNTDAARKVKLSELDGVRVYRMLRLGGLNTARMLLALGPQRLSRISWQVLSRSRLRRAAPLSFQLKFIGQAANYDKFLAGGQTDLLHVHHAEFRQYICQQLLGVDMPLLATVHSATVMIHPYPDWLVSLVKANYSRAPWLIAVSNFVKHMIVRHGADPSRVTVIPNGVDVDAFTCGETKQAREQLGLPVDPFIVMFSGRLSRPKSVDVLLRAFRRCVTERPGMLALVVGAGEEEDNLVRLARELGIAGAVKFVGHQPLSEMPIWCQACNVFVLPSWSEGLSVSILEALASGRPVITTHPDIGEHDVVRPGETGLLTHYGDVEELAQAIDQLASSRALVHRMGINARRLAERELSWDVVARKTVEVYRMLLQERRGKDAGS